MIIAQRPYSWNPNDLEKVDAVEVWNGMDSKANNKKARETAIQLDKPGVIVSNSKILRDMGTSYTLVKGICAKEYPKSIAQQIKRKVFLNHPEGRRRTSHLSRLVQALAIAEVKLTGNKS